MSLGTDDHRNIGDRLDFRLIYKAHRLLIGIIKLNLFSTNII